MRYSSRVNRFVSPLSPLRAGGKEPGWCEEAAPFLLLTMSAETRVATPVGQGARICSAAALKFHPKPQHQHLHGPDLPRRTELEAGHWLVWPCHTGTSAVLASPQSPSCQTAREEPGDR